MIFEIENPSILSSKTLFAYMFHFFKPWESLKEFKINIYHFQATLLNFFLFKFQKKKLKKNALTWFYTIGVKKAITIRCNSYAISSNFNKLFIQMGWLLCHLNFANRNRHRSFSEIRWWVKRLRKSIRTVSNYIYH